ncbi:MAG: DsrE family protein [Nitrospirae bacterium]|nr:DsrE family protein [Nitrospirota bacterium]
MTIRNKKLGLLLSTPPQNSNLETVIRLTETALAEKDQVYLYLIDQGALAMDHPRLNSLIEQGLKLFVCAYGAERHHVALSGNAIPCGLVVLSDLIKGCDQFLSFN